MVWNGFWNYSRLFTQIEKLEDGSPGRFRVTYKSTETGEELIDEFNTVMLFSKKFLLFLVVFY